MYYIPPPPSRLEGFTVCQSLEPPKFCQNGQSPPPKFYMHASQCSHPIQVVAQTGVHTSMCIFVPTNSQHTSTRHCCVAHRLLHAPVLQMGKGNLVDAGCVIGLNVSIGMQYLNGLAPWHTCIQQTILLVFKGPLNRFNQSQASLTFKLV